MSFLLQTCYKKDLILKYNRLRYITVTCFLTIVFRSRPLQVALSFNYNSRIEGTMQTVNLKIGTNVGTEKIQYEVPVSIPADWAEVQSLEIPETVKAACFNRGWRIKLQEDSGARDRLQESTVDERKDKAGMVKILAAIVADFISDPTAKRAGRPSRPQEVVIPADSMDKKALAQMTEVLKAQGIKVTIK